MGWRGMRGLGRQYRGRLSMIPIFLSTRTSSKVARCSCVQARWMKYIDILSLCLKELPMPIEES
jgi:hypothetical protein